MGNHVPVKTSPSEGHSQNASSVVFSSSLFFFLTHAVLVTDHTIDTGYLSHTSLYEGPAGEEMGPPAQYSEKNLKRDDGQRQSESRAESSSKLLSPQGPKG